MTLLLVLLLANCRPANDKGKYLQTVKLKNGLYVETYITFGQGAFGSDLVDDYLTDSLNFRIRVGTFDEYYEPVYYEPMGMDSVRIVRHHRSEEINGTLELVGSDVYSLKELRKLQNAARSEIVSISK